MNEMQEQALYNMQAELEFDEVAHIYTRNGMILPSVTTIMRPLTAYIYDIIPPDVLAAAAQKGTNVHRAVEFYEQYGWDKVAPEITGYVEAWKKFRIDHPDLEIVASEQRGYHPVYGYAGTMDIIARDVKNDSFHLMDIKTGSVASPMMWAVQLSAYAEMLRHFGIDVASKTVIHLINNGAYKLYKIDANEFSTFTACVVVKTYQQKMKGE